MSTVITHSAGTITPTFVDGYAAARTARTIVHPILGTSNVDVTYRPASLRAGRLRLGFTLEADAASAVTILSGEEAFTLTSTERDHIDMTFVVTGGDVEIELDDATRDVWVVTVPYQEVAL